MAGSGDPPPEEPKRAINTGPGEAVRIESESGKRARAWSVSWQTALLEYEEEGKYGGTMKGVRGTIYQNDKPVSDFSADEGFADKASDLLRLRGNVRVVSRESRAVLTCGQMDWLSITELLQAQGKVRVETPTYAVGDFPVIWATPQLDEAGTPDRFAPQRERMKSYQTVVAALATVAMASGPNGAQNRISFRDKAGTMQLSNFTSWKSRAIPGQNRITFSGSGNPLVSSWTSQQLVAESKTIEGVAQRGAQGYELVEATMGGGVKSTVTRPSGAGGTATQTVVMNSQTVKYSGANTRVNLEGGVTVNQTDAAAQQSMVMTGARGVVDLVPPGTKAARPIRTAVLEGPVRIEMKGVQDATQSVGGQNRTVKRPFTVVAKASRLDFNGTAGTLTLTGNVEIDGEDALMVGDVRAAKAVVTLSETGEPIGIDLEGAPTVTRYTEKRGRG